MNLTALLLASSINYTHPLFNRDINSSTIYWDTLANPQQGLTQNTPGQMYEEQPNNSDVNLVEEEYRDVVLLASMNSSSSSLDYVDGPPWYKHKYTYMVPPMILFCLAAVVVNLRVLISVRWIRRPLTPTVFITLSLAAADTFAPILLGTGLLFNSFLAVVLKINWPTWLILSIDMIRITGVIITVLHLLALAANHWLGILRPLHYSSMVTTRRLITLTVLLWCTPSVVMGSYYFGVLYNSHEGLDGNTNSTAYLQDVNFRIAYSSFLIGPVILMCLIYVHILFIVRKHQKAWSKLSRSGSKKNKSTSTNLVQQKRTMEGNIKAIYTTLLILGSCIIGWMPATIVFLLICNQGCLYETEEITRRLTDAQVSVITFTVNTFLILKSLVNPIIYSTRMIEIIEGTRRMENAFRRTFTPRNNNSNQQHSSTNQPLNIYNRQFSQQQQQQQQQNNRREAFGIGGNNNSGGVVSTRVKSEYIPVGVIHVNMESAEV